MPPRADKVEERWTPTTIHATFAFRDLPSSYCTTTTTSYRIPINLRLLNLGWTFRLSLKPKPIEAFKKKGPRPYYSYSTPCNWTFAALSFHQHDGKIPWGNTSMQVRFSLLTTEDVESLTIGTINFDLDSRRTPSVEFPLKTSYTLSSNQRTKLSLTVTIQDCPLENGLFQAISDYDSDAEAQTQLVRRSGDRVLSRSLATGQLFDVKFLSFSTRSGNLLPTHASLSVLEKHVNLPDTKLGEEWKNAIVALNDYVCVESKLVKEISCPNDDEYELDSDFEEEDEETSSRVELGTSPLPRERDTVVILEGKRQESSTTRSSSSWSSCEEERASEQDSADFQPEEVTKDLEGPPPGTADHERTVLVKFAAHRTWHAFLWYCYTGYIEFNTLKSQAEPGIRRLPLTQLTDGPPPCSPKSMYRLAGLVGNNDLKAKALEAIRQRMVKANILDETFSVFTSKYPDVRQVQLGILMKYIGTPEVKEGFLRKVNKFGDMPHAVPVLFAFCDKLAALPEL